MYEGPTCPSPFDPWQLAHPDADASCCPAAAAGVKTTEAVPEFELQEVNKPPAKNNEMVVHPATFRKTFFGNIVREYSPSQVEFGIVVKRAW